MKSLGASSRSLRAAAGRHRQLAERQPPARFGSDQSNPGCVPPMYPYSSSSRTITNLNHSQFHLPMPWTIRFVFSLQSQYLHLNPPWSVLINFRLTLCPLWTLHSFLIECIDFPGRYSKNKKNLWVQLSVLNKAVCENIFSMIENRGLRLNSKVSWMTVTLFKNSYW